MLRAQNIQRGDAEIWLKLETYSRASDYALYQSEFEKLL